MFSMDQSVIAVTLTETLAKPLKRSVIWTALEIQLKSVEECGEIPFMKRVRRNVETFLSDNSYIL